MKKVLIIVLMILLYTNVFSCVDLNEKVIISETDKNKIYSMLKSIDKKFNKSRIYNIDSYKNVLDKIAILTFKPHYKHKSLYKYYKLVCNYIVEKNSINNTRDIKEFNKILESTEWKCSDRMEENGIKPEGYKYFISLYGWSDAKKAIKLIKYLKKISLSTTDYSVYSKKVHIEDYNNIVNIEKKNSSYIFNISTYSRCDFRSIVVKKKDCNNNNDCIFYLDKVNGGSVL